MAWWAGRITVLFIACFVLLVSIFKSATPTYNFTQPASVVINKDLTEEIEYPLPYPGSVLPDHILWPTKALRDWAWIFVNRDPVRRAELYLLFADKRILMAQRLIKNGNANLGVPTALKAEQYLESAYKEQEAASKKGVNTGDFLEKLASASLKHMEIIRQSMDNSPEDAKPGLNQIMDVPKSIYEKSVHGLNEKQRPAPKNQP